MSGGAYGAAAPERARGYAGESSASGGARAGTASPPSIESPKCIGMRRTTERCTGRGGLQLILSG